MALALSFALDLALGEPPLWLHPVVWTGRISERLIRPYRGRAYGVFLWFASVAPVLVSLSALWFLPFPWSLLSVYPLKSSFSVRLLYRLVKGSIPVTEESRRNAQQLVRRDVINAEPGLVRSAVVESLFESTVDGIVSPLFWYAVLGLPGALLQRLANTMDSMVGYKTKELEREGWFSAKVDTALNYIPARLTGLLILASGYLLGYRPRGFLKTLREAKRVVESPNARWAFASASSVLKVRLEKRGHYVVGEGELPKDEDVIKALKVFRVTLALFLILEVAVIVPLSYLSPLLRL